MDKEFHLILKQLFIFSEQPMITIPIPPKGPKVTSLLWGTLDERLITGHENGDIVQWDVKEHQKVNIVSDHGKTISDMQLSPDRKFTFLPSFVVGFWGPCSLLKRFLNTKSNYELILVLLLARFDRSYYEIWFKYL